MVTNWTTWILIFTFTLTAFPLVSGQGLDLSVNGTIHDLHSNRYLRSNQMCCGNGNQGNGICSNGECCSKWGWCGTTPEYCSGSAPSTPTTTQNTLITLEFLSTISDRIGTVAGIHNKILKTPRSFSDQVTQIAGRKPGLWSSDFHFDAVSYTISWAMVEEAKWQWDDGALISILW